MSLKHSDIIGKQAKDSVTGFSGTLTAVTEWMNGCVRYCLQPNKLDKDGKVIDANWFDSEQVLIDEKKETIFEKISKAAPLSGGPRNDPPEW